LSNDILGVDIGGVIIDRVNDDADTSFFSENYLRTTAVPDAFEVIRDLVEKRFRGRVHLVSKCGRKVEAKTLDWLGHHRFHELTGVPPANVHFCRERHEKAGICERVGITHFIDDRLEVLGYLTSVPSLFLFRPSPEEMEHFAQYLPRVRVVSAWQEVRSALVP
jgi:hypothetical protein